MRRKDREVTDIQPILHIIEKAKILRLGLFDGEYTCFLYAQRQGRT